MTNNNQLNLPAIMRRGFCEEIVADGGGWEAAAQVSVLNNWLSTSDKEHATYVGNAFSLQMITTENALVSITNATWDDLPADAISCIGHADTARIASVLAGRNIPCQRSSVSLKPGDVLFVIQVTGGRLPEGCTSLPEGVRLELKRVLVR